MVMAASSKMVIGETNDRTTKGVANEETKKGVARHCALPSPGPT
jgi:hypothetical protein